jgi:predicted RecB family nuclease
MDTATGCARITEKVLRAYCNCVRKSYLLMFSRDQSKPNEHALVMEHRKELVRANYLDRCAPEMDSISPMPYPKRPMVPDRIADSAISADTLTTEAALFYVVPGTPSSEGVRYEPVIFTTSHAIRQEDKVEVYFAGYVLSKIQSAPPLKAKVILLEGRETTVRLLDSINRILPAITVLKGWANSRPEPPAVMLNKHCPYCEFQHVCKPIAEKEDNISLLGRIGEKELRRYEKKGIFTIKQLSFLYRPKRQNRRAKLRPVAHKYELQALALRTGKIYLHGEPVVIPHAATEIFFDIEALPDSNFHYLIGLIVCTPEKSQSFQLWADCQTDEASIWTKFAALIDQYPSCPLFHYGSFERKAIQKMGKLYGTPIEPILKRLFNVNTCIFGKVYFPVRSNSLKDICRFLGLSWTAHNASGLQSVVWRYQYEDTGDAEFRHLLLTYNYEDCNNLRCLTLRLRDIAANGTHSSDIRFADIEGGSITDNASRIVGHFNKLLQSAHGSYEQAKIVFKKNSKTKIPHRESRQVDHTRDTRTERLTK